VIPRKEADGAPISASRVRALLKEQNFAEIARIVPETTLGYWMGKYAAIDFLVTLSHRVK
jgi:[citrate (pro-3S)-lyase] ligase